MQWIISSIPVSHLKPTTKRNTSQEPNRHPVATKIEKDCATEGDYEAYKADLAVKALCNVDSASCIELSPNSVRQYMLLVCITTTLSDKAIVVLLNKWEEKHYQMLKLAWRSREIVGPGDGA